MFYAVPYYGLRAYALLFSRHGTREAFGQSELDWIVGESMRKKIFALLLRAGWLAKRSRATYACVAPERVMAGLLEFKVPELMRKAGKPYVFTGLSAIEVWSDYSYVQRSAEKSPYFLKVLQKDLAYWQRFFSSNGVPCYVGSGATIGEYVILLPAARFEFSERHGLKVEGLAETMRMASANDIYSYAYKYMRDKYGPSRA